MRASGDGWLIQAAWSAAWSRSTGASYYLGTVTSTTRKAAVLKLPSAAFNRIGIVATSCRSCGQVGVYVDGTLIGKVDLFSTSTRNRRLFILPGARFREGTITLKALRANKAVKIDGLAISRS